MHPPDKSLKQYHHYWYQPCLEHVMLKSAQSDRNMTEISYMPTKLSKIILENIIHYSTKHKNRKGLWGTFLNKLHINLENNKYLQTIYSIYIEKKNK